MNVNNVNINLKKKENEPTETRKKNNEHKTHLFSRTSFEKKLLPETNFP